MILPLAPSGAFRNEPFVDFKSSANEHAMKAALETVGGMLGHEYDLIIGGERVRTKDKIRSINPAKPSQVVGIHQEATAEHAQQALAAALKAFETWQFVSTELRASLLLRAAALIRDRKFEFCAWLVYEVGKNWAEADADVAETIDFLEFYAREAIRLAAAQPPIQYPGERNQLLYIPLGVGAVIPPWNFPFAIMAGMTAASIVCGNTVVLKPSSDAPTIAARFLDVLEEAGMPPGVVNLCQGGPAVGRAIVEDPKTRYIAFTGSKAVGLEIHERAAKTQKGQLWIKRTVLEMGGKDAIIVSSDADIDAAVEGVVASAFGFNGQKCSACSRAIVEDPIYDAFVERVEARVAQIKIGDPLENNYMGPVVNETALKRILNYIEIGKGEGRLVSGGKRGRDEGGRLLHSAYRDRRCFAERSHRAGRDLRACARGHSREGLRRSARRGQQHGVRPHRLGLFRRPPQARPRTPYLPRRQSLLQPQEHRRDGGRTPLRRLQHVRHGFEGRRPGLPAAIHAGKVRRREAAVNQ